VVIVRYADDAIFGFQYEANAKRFVDELRERLLTFGLELHPDMTRLLEFGRYAATRRQVRGEGKPETFDFLGFTHLCGKTRSGRFALVRKTVSSRMCPPEGSPGGAPAPHARPVSTERATG
jgi:hypothetical protein